jgi:hypothetical protein
MFVLERGLSKVLITPMIGGAILSIQTIVVIQDIQYSLKMRVGSKFGVQWLMSQWQVM